ncbi:hypothetical protein [Streptacidiphilus sp. P02-A3a]|uniref:hypothetical protein n=1 Tax=Streptacidiphilus sp. P02-A3a TaxID=2704468 RepID=UPI0015FADD86|nr:hypothetical protein [Streptacidiphilus sp. P02-A3a]QMU70110.1 hypothetical protein GXP74_19625 [Streptacidiphilus sp. P02-A3a]QMU70437.1 hypothetical protein GXP74_21735 [Streptacidiphilus sp. P02-A3a]
MAEKTALTRLTGSGDGSGECGQGDCPNVYATDRRSFVFQGEHFTGFQPPEGEGLVEIPEAVLREAFRALGW